MATVTYVKVKKQSPAAMYGVINYCKREDKVRDIQSGRRIVSGIKCNGENTFREFMITKAAYDKLDGTYYYRYVQSFSYKEGITHDNESVLDEQIYKQLAVMRDGLSKCSRQIESDIRSWMSQKNNVSKRIKRLHDNINITELEIEQILMEKIEDRDNAERYERMIEKRNREIEGFKNEIAKIENIDKTIKERKKATLIKQSRKENLLSNIP